MPEPTKRFRVERIVRPLGEKPMKSKDDCLWKIWALEAALSAAHQEIKYWKSRYFLIRADPSESNALTSAGDAGSERSNA